MKNRNATVQRGIEAAVRTDLPARKADFAALEIDIERSMRVATWRIIGALAVMKALFLALERLVIGG